MNKAILLCCIIGYVFTSAAQDIRVMTYNIRYSTASDSLNAWAYRKDKLASVVQFNDVQLLGVQEALNSQMTDLQERLPRFKYTGGGRDDGKQGGEYSAIFYDTAAFALLKTATFWLSQTPQVPGSKGWDAAFPRIVTWAELKDRKSNKIFYAFNTHFDHMGKLARRESAKLLLKQVDSIAGNMKAVITGDFNATPDDEPIRIIADKNTKDHLTDSKEISLTGHYGPTGTFNGFGPKEQTGLPIDYIFLKGAWRVKKHATLSETWGGRFASDHFAVFAVLQL